MTQPLSTMNIGDLGVAETAALILRLGWHFRPQLTADVGIDALIEPRLDGQDSGRLIAAQIKSGSSAFAHPVANGQGWTYYFGRREAARRDYWLRFAAPVILVLCDTDSRIAYWQLITSSTAVKTRAGFKVFVPCGQKIEAGSAARLASIARELPADDFIALLRRIPESCAAALSELDRVHPILARRMALQLTAEPADPKKAVDALSVESDSKWPSSAWEALADYANEHGLQRQAAEFFEKAADVCDDSERSCRLQAFSGLLYADDQPGKAADLLGRAVASPAASLLSAIGMASINHTGRGPIATPQAIIDHPHLAAEDPTVQRFLAEQQARQGNLTESLRLHEAALSLSPNTPRQQLAVAELMIRIATPAGGVSQAGYCRRAVTLAASARAMLRRWCADSRHASEVLLLAHQVSGDEAEALRTATAAPDGNATPKEASAPAVAFHAARICYELGRLSDGDLFGERVLAARHPMWTAYWHAVRADHCGADADERQARWRALIDAGATNGILLVALNSLAALGVWPLPELDALREEGRLARGSYELVQAHAQRQSGDTMGALQTLRKCFRHSVIAAEQYARLLAETGDVDGCVRVCDETALDFGDHRLALLALDVLNNADRPDDAIQRAQSLLGVPHLPFGLRRRIRSNLIGAFILRREWANCERLALEGVTESEQRQRELKTNNDHTSTAEETYVERVRSDFSWLAIISQLNRGQLARASETLNTFRPDINTEQHLRTWCDLNRLNGWTAETAEQALAHAESSFADSGIRGQMLFSLIETCRPTASAEPNRDTTDIVWVKTPLYERIVAAWNSHVRTLDRPNPWIPGKLEESGESIDQLAARLDSDRRLVWSGRTPIGSVSDGVRTFYALGICQRLAGIIPGSHPDVAIQDLEAAAAAETLGGNVVVESSALYVLTGSRGLWDIALSSFASVLLPEASMRDLLSSHVAARSQSAAVSHMHLSHDQEDDLPTSDTVTWTRDILVRTEELLSAAQQCAIRPIDDSDANPDALGHEHAHSPWRAAVVVAIKDQIPLLSDDRVLRDEVRAQGGKAFGTLALLEAMLNNNVSIDFNLDDVGRSLFTAALVDLPSAIPIVLTSCAEGSPDIRCAWLNLSRAQFWAAISDHDVFAGVIASIATTVGASSREHFDGTVTAMSIGLLAYAPSNETAAVLATILVVHGKGFTDETITSIIDIVSRTASAYGLDPAEQIGLSLLAACSDPSIRSLIPADANDVVARALARHRETA